MNKKYIIMSAILLSLNTAIAQNPWVQGGNTAGGNQSQRVGTNNNRPFRIETNNTQRMFFDNNGGGTNGYIGIGTNFSAPVSPLHVQGDQNSTFPQGWNRALSISNNGTIAFLKDGAANNPDNNFFMGAPSNTPNGDFYFGTTPNINNPSGSFNYSYSVIGRNNPVGLNLPGSQELGSMLFYNNSYFVSRDGAPSYVGINTVEAKRVLDVVDTNPQLRLTAISNNNSNLGLYTDLHTFKGGLDIRPQVDNNRLTVFIHNDNPAILMQRSFDVNGNARFRFVPEDVTSESLILGKRITVDGDVELRRLDFTGNASDVLLGDGTWGTSTNQANNGVSVDPTGSFIQLGNNPGLTTAQFLNNREIPMNNFNLVFTDGGGQAQTNSIGLGTNAPTAKFHIVRNLQTVDVAPTALLVQHNDVAVGGPFTAQAYGIKSEITGENRANFAGHFSATGAKVNYGIWSEANSTNTSASALGIYTTGSGSSSTNIGIVTIASPNSSTNVAFNAGIQSTSFSGVGNAYGGYFTASASTSTANSLYGIYATTFGSATNANYAGYFNGDIFVTGAYLPSDANMKTNVVDYDSSLYVINQLSPKTFEYTDVNYSGMNLPDGHQYGLIAQEVEQVLPSIVTDNVHPAQYDSLGNQIHPAYDFKGVDYTSLIPVLVGGIQEQQAIINTQDSTILVQDSLINNLNSRLTNLENCLGNLLPLLCQINNSMIQENNTKAQEDLRSVLNLELTDGESIILEQNVPNPFAEQTTINYTIPETVAKAQIHFYNQNGQLINTIDIDERGNGQINVFASDLSSGIYTYTLVADGQVVATKRMVKN